MPKLEPTGPLFTSQKGGAVRRPRSSAAAEENFAKAGVAGASSHSGRRTFATRLGSKGVGIRVIQALLGHASVTTTARYVEAWEHQQAAAVELL